eukprot:scaffold71100_cov77-Cyclotella_meneghiniana.AAC.1
MDLMAEEQQLCALDCSHLTLTYDQSCPTRDTPAVCLLPQLSISIVEVVVPFHPKKGSKWALICPTRCQQNEKPNWNSLFAHSSHSNLLPSGGGMACLLALQQHASSSSQMINRL